MSPTSTRAPDIRAARFTDVAHEHDARLEPPAIRATHFGRCAMMSPFWRREWSDQIQLERRFLEVKSDEEDDEAYTRTMFDLRRRA